MTTLVLVDPPRAPFWPLGATRPLAELLAGTRSFRARWEARHGPVTALWCDPAVAGARLAGPAPSINTWPPAGDGLAIALSTWIPPRGWEAGSEPAEFRAGGEPVAWRLESEQARALEGARGSAEARERLAALHLPATEAGGRSLTSAWAVVDANPQILVEDAEEAAGVGEVRGVDPFVLLGAAADLRVGPGVTIGPFAVLDARDGPVVLGEDVAVEPHALLRGPLFVGRGSTVLGGAVSGSSIGPHCRIRGEVEQSIVQGWTNKAHEGFLGHSCLGAWVNLGAGTTTSDLKNTYGTVRVQGPEGRSDTGLLKVGAFIGDHAKTGIGTLLPSGARIGVGTNLFGGMLAPPWLPDFTWHDGREATAVRWEPFLQAATRMMARRDETLTDEERGLLAALHEAR